MSPSALQTGLPGVAPDELRLIQMILREVLAPTHQGRVFAFGSRVRGSHRPDSDLDLGLDLSPAPNLETLGTLRRLFEESRLPYGIDLIDETRVPTAILANLHSLKDDEKRIILEIPDPSLPQHGPT